MNGGDEARYSTTSLHTAVNCAHPGIVSREGGLAINDNVTAVEEGDTLSPSVIKLLQLANQWRRTRREHRARVLQCDAVFCVQQNIRPANGKAGADEPAFMCVVEKMNRASVSKINVVSN